jgi:hypothetical protein
MSLITKDVKHRCFDRLGLCVKRHGWLCVKEILLICWDVLGVVFLGSNVWKLIISQVNQGCVALSAAPAAHGIVQPRRSL